MTTLSCLEQTLHKN